MTNICDFRTLGEPSEDLSGTKRSRRTFKDYANTMTKVTLIEKVREDCDLVLQEINFIRCRIYEEYNKPVVVCHALLQNMRIPSLVLRVFKGYPDIGTVTYAFERPPMGWCSPLKEIRASFKASAALYDVSCGVDDLLREWASAISEAIQKEEKDS